MTKDPRQGCDVTPLLSGEGRDIPLFKVFMPKSVMGPLRRAEDRTISRRPYTLRVTRRDAFVGHMRQKGITVSRVHSRNDLHTVFRDFRSSLPGVDEFDGEQVSIPVGWWLSRADRERVVRAVAAFGARKR